MDRIMLNDIQIIFLDIDNTLVTRKKKFEVSIDNKIALKNIQREKVFVVLATGRTMTEIKKVWNQIHFNEYSNYIIYSSGGVIENLETKELLLNEIIPEKTVKKVVNYCLNHNFYFKLSNSPYTWKQNKINFGEKFFSKFFIIYLKKLTDKAFLDYSNNNKIGIFLSFSRKKNLIVINEMKKIFPDLEITTSTRELYIEITPKNVTKALAAKKLLEELQISSKNAMAIGDSMNDYELFKLVENPVAVKNASKKLKTVAKYQTKSVKKNGVAYAIKQIK